MSCELHPEERPIDLQKNAIDYIFNKLKNEVDKRVPKVIRVYSFRPASEYLFNELYFSYLNCSPVSSFNDPLDCPLFLFLGVGTGKTKDYSHYENLMKEMSVAANRMKIRCFSSNNADDTSVPINTLMWAHYANSHKGILLCYEIPDILENDCDRLSFFEKVTYSDSFRNLSKDNLGESQIATDLLPMVSTKSKAWSYEQEVRLIHFSRQEESRYPEIRIKKSYLKKIFFGTCTSWFDKERIEQISRHYPDLELYDIMGDPENLLALKSFPHKTKGTNIFDYAFGRAVQSKPDYWPRMVETIFRGALDEIILDSNSLEEYLSHCDSLPEFSKTYVRGYVALYKMDKSKLTKEPESIEDLDELVKEVMELYYRSRRNIHLVRDYLGITDYYEEKVEID